MKTRFIMLSLNTEHISRPYTLYHIDRNTTFLFHFSIIYLFFSNTVSTGQQMTNHIQFSYCIFEFINHSVGTLLPPPSPSSGISINTTTDWILPVILNQTLNFPPHFPTFVVYPQLRSRLDGIRSRIDAGLNHYCPDCRLVASPSHHLIPSSCLAPPSCSAGRAVVSQAIVV